MSPRLLVTGSRDFNDRDLMTEALKAAWIKLGRNDSTVLVHGAARGADTLAASVWQSKGLPVEPHPADWNTLSRRAGHVRNAEMVAAGADLCLAFPVGESRGTRGCMGLVRAAGIELEVFE